MGDASKPSREEIPHGHRLIPPYVDQFASETPNRTFARIPKTNDLKDGYQDVTFWDIARGVNRAAKWVEGRFGRDEGEFETLAYVGVFDLRYFLFMVGAGKVGYKTLLPSPRNSLEGQLSLFSKTSCKVLLISEHYPIAPDLISALGIHPIPVPSLDFFLSKDGDVENYPYTKTFEEAKNDPLAIIHTSGSTGLPKPVILKHGWFAAMDAQIDMPATGKGEKALWLRSYGKRVFAPLPPFHAAGINILFSIPLWYNAIVIWAPSNAPISGFVADQVLSATPVDTAYFVPSILEEMAQLPSSIAKLQKLSAIGFGGGPLDPAVGALLWDSVPLLNTLGTTELSTVPIYSGPQTDWAYFHYNPKLKGIQFRPVGDGSCEMWIVRHESTDRFHSMWYTFPEKDEVPMNDLYVPHPEHADTWLYIGRADDVLVFSNGEKLNPTSMESTLRGHPAVIGALVVGQGQFSPAIIIELTLEIAAGLKTAAQKTAFLEDEIWKYIVDANQHAPSHGQLEQDKIILSDPSKPFARAGKGTVQRDLTAKMYAKEIEQLYRHSEDDEVLGVPQIDLEEHVSIVEKDVGLLIGKTIGVKDPLDPSLDFFAAGMDSLHVMTTVKHLKYALVGVSHDDINTRLIYSHPTVRALAASLKAMKVSDRKTNGITREQKMEQTVEDYIQKLPSSVAARYTANESQTMTVLLTGSTGSLGSYLLHTILSSSKVAKVYCLNRRDDAAVYQATSNFEKGLAFTWDERVEFISADLSHDSLGLPNDVYDRLTSEVSTIIHNQWQVNFNLTLASFTPQLSGVLNLIKFSATSQHSPPITFTSSIGTVAHYPSLHPGTLVPETELDDPSIVGHGGYSESKWIAERLLHESGKKGVRSNVVRVGQITGAVEEKDGKGEWNKKEWLPSIIISSKHLGYIPTDLPEQDNIAWIPVDILSRILFELVEVDILPVSTSPKTRQSNTQYYHLANPASSTWSSLVPTIQDFYSFQSSGPLKAVTFSTWFRNLEESAAAVDISVEANPAVKLLSFYRSMRDGKVETVLSTGRARDKSATLRTLKGVGTEWMRVWLRQWEGAGRGEEREGSG